MYITLFELAAYCLPTSDTSAICVSLDPGENEEDPPGAEEHVLGKVVSEKVNSYFWRLGNVGMAAAGVAC
jgi:hypothetical protein